MKRGCWYESRHLLINLRSPRDYVGPPFIRPFALSPLDGASVREAHCEQASTVVREAYCTQATVACLVTFEVEIFFRDQQRIVYEIRLIAIREVSPPFGEEHRGLEQDISFPGNKHLLILRKCYAVHINASSL